MSYQREVRAALESKGFTYFGSDLDIKDFDSFQIWETPDGEEQFKLILDEYEIKEDE